MPLTTNADEINRHIELNMFDYSYLSDDLVYVYSSYETRFKELFEWHSDAWKLENCFFYIKNSNHCNAAALKSNGFNIINITNGYPILIDKKFQETFFEKIIFVSLTTDKETSDAYCDPHENIAFDFRDFILECSVRFTFHHEFRHILQFNFSRSNRFFNSYENLNSEIEFSMVKHAWEFDADRNATYRVLQFAREKHSALGYTDTHLKCILYVALGGIIITMNLFYFNIINDPTNRNPIKIAEFYTKKHSHPHSLVRIDNVISYFISCANDDFPNLKLELHETLANTLKINNQFFESLTGDANAMKQLLNESQENVGAINAYNNELCEFAIRNKAIKNLLTFTGTKLRN